MTDSHEKSDDLIAELAKLMASGAQGGGETATKPSVVKLPPVNEGAAAQPASVRIPGMDAPKPAAASPAPITTPQVAAPAATPSVRIPGMVKPVDVTDVPASAPSAAPRPATKFDFGTAPSVAPVMAPEPMTNWQTREVPKPVPVASTRPSVAIAASPLPMAHQPAPQSAPAPVSRPEAKADAPVAPAGPIPMAPAPTPVTPRATVSNDSFNFNFNLGSSASGGDKSASEEDDPIAALIAAELDAGQPVKTPPTPTPTSAAPSPAPQVRPVDVVPAPTLVGRLPGPTPMRANPAPAPVAVKPVQVAPRPVESDRFQVAPVFGLGGKVSQPASASPQPAPAPSAPAAMPADADPMEEIASLIGEAVRVELSNADKPRVAPAPMRPAAAAASPAPQPPVVPPLNTGFAPRRAGIKDRDAQVHAAEDAILAAAAASGSDVGRVEAPVRDERQFKRMKVKPPKTRAASSGARQYIGIAVAGTLLLAAGFGLFWVLGMGRDDPSAAPVLTADASPAKIEPVVTPAPAAEPRSPVFDEIDGVASVDSGETLVSRDETAGASVADVARVVAPDQDSTEGGLANRKVRTVTVRPDGTIVSGDEAVAGTEALPVERPNVPEIPGAAVEPSELLTAAVASANAEAGQEALPSDPVAALVDNSPRPNGVGIDPAATASLETPGESVPTVFDASIVAPIPMPRPADRARLSQSAAQMASAEPVASAAPADLPLVGLEPEAPAARASGTYVQLSSQPSEGEAASSLRSLQSRMSSMLNGTSLEIRPVDLGSRGMWYRVVLPTGSFQEATQTCASIKSNGGDCVAVNG